jgi:peptidyl-prolyl cis-trans isomerase D
MPAPEDGSPTREIVDEDPDATYLVELARVSSGNPADMPVQERELLRQRIAGETGGILQQQFEAGLRERAEVIVY